MNDRSLMMNSPQNSPPNLIDQARALLSPYLDDEVTQSERELVESMLAQSPTLQQELSALRETVSLLQSLPRAAAPRPFTLGEADLGQISPPAAATSAQPWWAWLKPFAGGAIALAAVILIGAYLFNAFQSGSTRQTMETIAMSSMADEAVAPADISDNAAASEAAPLAGSSEESAAESVLPATEGESAAEQSVAKVEDSPSQPADVVVAEEVPELSAVESAEEQAEPLTQPLTAESVVDTADASTDDAATDTGAAERVVRETFQATDGVSIQPAADQADGSSPPGPPVAFSAESETQAAAGEAQSAPDAEVGTASGQVRTGVTPTLLPQPTPSPAPTMTPSPQPTLIAQGDASPLAEADIVEDAAAAEVEEITSHEAAPSTEIGADSFDQAPLGEVSGQPEASSEDRSGSSPVDPTDRLASPVVVTGVAIVFTIVTFILLRLRANV